MIVQQSIPLFKVRLPAGIETALGKTLASGYIAQGAQVEEFERRFGEYAGNLYACAVSDISGALTLSLFLAGVRPGDHVIVSPMVCLATSMPIANLFAVPIWCDVDPLTGMPTARHVRAALTPQTKAIVVSHWSGDIASIEEIGAVAKSVGIPLIEDASEAFGARICGRRPGNGTADFTAYSFGPVRQITCGEGAALLLQSPDEYERMRCLRRYGIHQPSFRLQNGDLNPYSDIETPGFNFGFNNLGATIGIAQFNGLEHILSRYQSNGSYYESALSAIPGLTLLHRRNDAHSGYWTYSLRVERRADLIRKLKEEGIDCQRLHLRNDRYRCFQRESSNNDLPGVNLFDLENLSIPCGWWVRDEDREKISMIIRSGW